MEFVKESKEKMKFTNHILERFVERTMNKSGLEIKQFLAQNEEQVKEKILKLYEYSELFWYGKIKDHNFAYFTINRDGWVFVIDKDKVTLITVYKVDLGLSAEFNKEYIKEIKIYVENEMVEIEELKGKNEIISAEAKEGIEELKGHINMLKQEILLNEERIKIIESDQQYKINFINLKEKQLQQKIEKFIGAKIFEK